MNKWKKIKKVADRISILAIIYAIIIIGKNAIDQSRLPEGVCPITNNRDYIYFAIILLVVTLLTTIMIDYKYKKTEERVSLVDEKGDGDNGSKN